MAADVVEEAPTYRRNAGYAFRQIRGTVLVLGSGREYQRLEGAAALVWLTLSTPCTTEALVERIRGQWPGVTDADMAAATDALSMLEGAGLVSLDGR